MFLAHHRSDHLTRAFLGVNQDKVFAAPNIFMKLTQFLVLGAETKHAARPGTEQGCDEHDRNIRRNRCVRAKCPRGHEHKCAEHADEKADVGTDKPGADKIQRFNVIAGVNTLFSKTGFIIADDVYVSVLDANGMQIIRNGASAIQIGREII